VIESSEPEGVAGTLRRAASVFFVWGSQLSWQRSSSHTERSGIDDHIVTGP